MEFLPSTFSLEQNYPNPFNPETSITFSLDKAGKATLTVYNMIGQKVATLIEKKLAEGVHQVDFSASNLPTGVYFYRLQVGNQVSMKKMVYMK